MSNINFLHDPDYIYRGNDLGVHCQKGKTTFRVWSPGAERLQVLIYGGQKSEVFDYSYDLNKSNHGTWFLELKGDFSGLYFEYQIYQEDSIKRTIDPYVYCTGTNSKRGLIVNLEKTNPPGWENDKRIKLENYVDAVIYELHVRDFSISPVSGINNKGKYLAFTEAGSRNLVGQKTGLAHLQELGITHVHLLPIFDFGSVDDENDKEYNWGYDPLFYNAPEGSYASKSDDFSRIIECKKMIKALHDRNIGVIMDVVYNHTYQTVNSSFNILVPGYYYRTNLQGHYSNGSGCGNELASERPMVKKFIIDSVKYWANEYHIDGFRFDLMALIDKNTMKDIEKTLHEIDSSIIIYGEPWLAGNSPLSPSERMTRGQQYNTRLAVFNDHYRNALKGDNDGVIRGFVSGEKERVDAVKKGVVGSIDYTEQINNFCCYPRETINYVSAHDNLTLWDKLQKSNPEDDEIIRIKMDRMAQAIIMTSQGVPFFAGGEEFLRTKYGERNSYNAGDRVNQLKWERKTKYMPTFNYYCGLIKLRRWHPAFRMRTAEEIKKHLHFFTTPHNTIGFILNDYANKDRWKDIVIIYNPNRERLSFTLPLEGNWKTVINEHIAGLEILNEFNGNIVEVNPISVLAAYKNS